MDIVKINNYEQIVNGFLSDFNLVFTRAKVYNLSIIGGELEEQAARSKPFLFIAMKRDGAVQ